MKAFSRAILAGGCTPWLMLVFCLFAPNRLLAQEFNYPMGPGYVFDEEGLKNLETPWSSGEAPMPPMPLTKPSTIVGRVFAGEGSLCALDGNSVKCWGTCKDSECNSPSTVDPVLLVESAYKSNCVLDQDQVKCWGYGAVPMNVPPLKKARGLAIGSDHGCAVDEEGVKCWQIGNYNPMPGMEIIETLKNTTEITLADGHGCALDSGQVRCWGYNNSGQLEVPMLKNPRKLRADYRSTCAIDDEGLKCWGNEKLFFPSTSALDFSEASYYGFCVREFDRIRCLRDLGHPSETYEITKNLVFLPNLELIANRMGAARAAYLSAMGKFALANAKSPLRDSAAYYLALALAGPAVLSAESADARERVIPHYQKGMSFVGNRLGYTDPENALKKIPRNAANKKIALQSMRESLNAAVGFLRSEEKAEAQAAIAKVNEAISDPADRKKLSTALRASALAMERMKKLNSPKTAYVPALLGLATQWLEK